MSRLNDLIHQVTLTNEALAADLQREVSALADRRSFGLNFERHVPETVELPGRPVRRGDKVRILPPRGQMPKASDEKLWQVDRIDRPARSRSPNSWDSRTPPRSPPLRSRIWWSSPSSV